MGLKDIFGRLLKKKDHDIISSIPDKQPAQEEFGEAAGAALTGTFGENKVNESFRSKMKRFWSSGKSKAGAAASVAGSAASAAAAAPGKVQDTVSSGFNQLLHILKQIFLLGVLPIAGIYLVFFSGIIQMGPIAIGVTLFGLAGFLFASYKEKGLYAVLCLLLIVIVVVPNTAIAVPGVDLPGGSTVEGEKVKLGTIILESGKDLNCYYHENLKIDLTPDLSGEQQEDIPAHCLDPIIDTDQNIQAKNYDLKVSSLRFDTPQVVPGSTAVLTLTIQNEADEERVATVMWEASDDLLLNEDPTGCDPNTRGSDTVGDLTYELCNVTIPAKINAPVIFIFGTVENPVSSSAKVDIGILYDASVSSTLTLRTTDTITERGTQGEIFSETTAGSANLIISAQNQPLFNNNPFLFGFNVKNNHPSVGYLLNPDATIMVPKDIVNESSSTCIGSEVIKQTQEECSGKIAGRGDYFCFKYAGAEVETEKKFSCSFRTNNDIGRGGSRTAIGELDYTYFIESSATLKIVNEA